MFRELVVNKLGKYISDTIIIQLKFFREFGRLCNFDDPKTFNEKLQWLKLYNRKPEYTIMVDKYEVKKYVAELIGEQYIIPTIGVWDNPDDIEFNTLPEKFVLKCNHNSGLGMCICKDKTNLNINKVKDELRKGLKQNYFYTGREWPYKNVKPRIIAEVYLEDYSKEDLNDYKFFCFDGVVKLVMITYGRGTSEGLHISYYDTDLNLLDMWHHKYPRYEGDVVKPKKYDELLRLASILSKGIPHARVDLYEVNGEIYFGEITFFNASGFGAFRPVEWDYKLGSWINLPNKKII